MQIWPMITKHDCMSANEERDGAWSCDDGHRACERQQWMSGTGFRNDGTCIYYGESHAVDGDGAPVEEGNDVTERNG